MMATVEYLARVGGDPVICCAGTVGRESNEDTLAAGLLIAGLDLSEEELREVLWVYRDRLVDLKKDPRLVYGMIFKNVGAAAGASLEHTHSQLIVTPIVPINVW